MKSATRAYSDAIVSAMREAGVYEAITTGQPSEISFSVAFGAAIARCELGLASLKTPEERATAAKACYDEALEQLIAADKAGTRKAEAMKVAVCPKCNLWFSSFKARNEHREEEHSAAAVQRRIAAEDDAEVAAAISAAREPLVVLAPPFDDAPIEMLDF